MASASSAGDDDAEAAAHVEDLVQLGVAYRAALGDQLEHARHRERVVDQVADLRLEPQQVEEAVAGDVRQPAHVDARTRAARAPRARRSRSGSSSSSPTVVSPNGLVEIA